NFRICLVCAGFVQRREITASSEEAEFLIARFTRLCFQMNIEDIGPRVVRCDVEGETLAGDVRKVDITQQNGFLVRNRSGENRPVRSDDRAPAAENQFLRLVLQRWQEFEFTRQVSRPENSSAGDDEAAALEGVVPAGDKIHLLDPRPRRNMDLLPRNMQGVTREGHPMLPADEPADACRRRVLRSQALAISLAPDETLGERRHNVAMTIEKSSVGVDREHGVVKSAMT